MHTGSCLCGAVRIEVRGDLPGPDACHCSQCRRWSGHVWASTDVRRENLTVTGEEHLKWFQSSPKARRGFCGTCGSVLFWDPPGRASVAVAMGAFDQPTGTWLAAHIFTADKGDYYDIADDAPQEAVPP
jgi:hypothetical protein